ncbi:MAG: hypothetical protein ACKVYV_15480 [Limisphaerales bacterium]
MKLLIWHWGRLAGWLLAGLPGVCPAAEVPAVAVVAGTGERGSDGDGGPALTARLDDPFGVVRGPDGTLWVADYSAHVIRRIAADGTISTPVGDGRARWTGDGGPATKASLNHPHEVRFDRAGRLVIADTSNHVIRRFDPVTGQITTLAGTGVAGYEGDGGPADRARLNMPISLQFGPDGALYVADIGNHVLRRVDASTGIITTHAGTGRPGPTRDGAPRAGTPLHGPRSLDFDRTGSLWLVTREGSQLLRLGADDRYQVAAGTGRKGFQREGGPGRALALSGPKGVAVAPDGSVYVADTENHAIRRLDPPSGLLTTVLGTGPQELQPGRPSETTLNRPHGVFVDVDGTVFVGDSETHRLLRFTPTGIPPASAEPRPANP